MRILMISKACLVGAYQRKLEEIAKFRDVDLMVAVPPSWKDGSREIHLERAHTRGYRLVVEPIALNGSFHMHFYPFIGRRLRSFRPDVVHIDEEPYNFATFHTLRRAERVAARTLWFSWQNLNRRYPLPFRWMERYCLRHTDHAIVGSEGARRVWREKGYEGPLAVIPQFGVDPDMFAPPKEPSSTEAFHVGYVGRLVPEKGVDLLIEALAGLDGEWTLSIVGAGSQRPALESLAQARQVGDRVAFRGLMPSTELPDFYRELDALVLPSRSRPNWVEQFGRVLIEAMGCGVPVVGAESGEIPHVIGDAGLTFPEDDVRSLRDRLRLLREDPEQARELGAQGRERVIERFTQEQIAAETTAVYREITG